MQQVFPTLRITDPARSKRFYIEGLGFQIDWEHRVDSLDPDGNQIRVCTPIRRRP